jgi:antitoxin YefM
MPKTVSYTEARANLASILQEANDTLEPIVIERRGKKAVALIDAAELSSIMETLHLLSSPANARALFKSLDEARQGKAVAMTLDELTARGKKARAKA